MCIILCNEYFYFECIWKLMLPYFYIIIIIFHVPDNARDSTCSTFQGRPQASLRSATCTEQIQAGRRSATSQIQLIWLFFLPSFFLSFPSVWVSRLRSQTVSLSVLTVLIVGRESAGFSAPCLCLTSCLSPSALCIMTHDGQ